jgi:tetratricopeptide (TPR) repeat protein
MQEPIQINKSSKFFNLYDWLAFTTSSLISLGVYIYTLAPTVTLEDSGELCVGGDYLGVPHPPGYPSWTVLVWLFARIFSFVKYMGQPNPAWGIALASAVCGAGAAGVTAMLICKSGRDMLRESNGSFHQTSETTQNAISFVSGIACSLLFAFSPVTWSQAVIAEVYSLNALFLAFIFLFTYRWMRQPDNRMLYIIAFTFGFGLTNYQVLALTIIVLAVVVLLTDIELFRDFLIAGIPYGITLVLILTDILPEIPEPLSSVFFTYLLLNFLVIVLVYYLLPRGRVVAKAIAFAQLGVSFYGMMALFSDLRNPPMNWGYPRTWQGFLHAISRGQYERITPAPIFSGRFLTQVGDYFEDLRIQFTLLIVPFAFLPFTIWQIRKKREVNALWIAGTLCASGIALAMVEKFILKTEKLMPIFGISLYKIMFAGAMIIACAGVLDVIIEEVKEMSSILREKKSSTLSRKLTVFAVFFAGICAVIYYIVALAQKILEITKPLRESSKTYSPEQAFPIFASALGLLLLIVLPLALFILVTWLSRDDTFHLQLPVSKSSRKWLIATLCGFIAMSIILVALANPKGDIQDAFIQKVKFISSHELYSFWIGYGFIFALAWFHTFISRIPAMGTLSLVVTFLLPLIPIRENAFNPELLKIYGGAEQNGHDFGWQFGNYQLRGASAINEELSPDEEPLPNPYYPPEMTPHAIFYGGTDPGRFVPTYMIYSARVREDVYLITQNALADGTYLNIMRDLYGDRIWIAAHPDSAEAFRIYVDEVKSGKRPANAALKIEDGRVQVQGAAGVMEINGIIAKMIFDHNKHKHDFYVEESYVIPWMYPYLTPHGLIMKINREPCPLPSENIRDDMDFWDWYTRRFLSDRKFLRDVVARKSFSKLRSAIAGLYSNRGKLKEAEKAFQEARALYPLSPEANFRIAYEVFLREGRFQEALDVMKEFKKLDPGSDRVDSLIFSISNTMQMVQEMHELETRMSTQKLDLQSAIKLASLYQQAGQMQKFMGLTLGMLQDTNLPPEAVFSFAHLLYRAKRTQEMVQALNLCMPRMPPNTPPQIFLAATEMFRSAGHLQESQKCMQEYLKRKPDDWKAWFDMTIMHLELHNTNSAIASLRQGLKFGGEEAQKIAQRDPRFVPLLKQAATPLPRELPGLPIFK